MTLVLPANREVLRPGVPTKSDEERMVRSYYGRGIEGGGRSDGSPARPRHGEGVALEVDSIGHDWSFALSN